MKSYKYKYVRLAISVALTMALLTGCGTKEKDKSSSAGENEPIISQETTNVPASSAEITSTDALTTDSITEPIVTPSIADGLTTEQRNSINMLNFLAVLTQEINASSNSRVFLENSYSSLINNTDPQAVDSRTLSELTGILDTLENYRMIAVKRDRIRYIYEQNQAEAVRAAMPNPLALLTAVRSKDLVSLVASVVYMAVDSYSSYESAMSSADLQYLQDGWSLDDKESEELHNRRKSTFSYMTRIVGDYGLPGKLALSEEAVDNFVSWQKMPVVRRIQMLEDNCATYQAYGGYWLALAESYYSNNEFEKCLAALDAYEGLGISIYRYDHEYAKVLPLAIVAAEKVYSESKYVEVAGRYVEALVKNTQYNEWALRYFAAQTDVDLYAKTKDVKYLKAAYSLTRGNVNYLIDEQIKLNKTYLAPVEKEEYPSGATKEQKQEIDRYNKLLAEQRKTELPPVYEPLLLNIELLFGLADELKVPETEYEKLNNIIYNNGESIFLVTPLDILHRSDLKENSINPEEIEISFSGKTLESVSKV